jgi:hypothetical protein
MDWKPISDITPDQGHVLFWGDTRHDADVDFTGWVAPNGRFYSDADGLCCKPKFWCKVTPPNQPT